MAKKKDNKDNATQNIGVDLGYGNVKAVAGNQRVIFPSVSGRAINVRFGSEDIASGYAGDQIEHYDASMWIGNLAAQHLRPEQQRRLRGLGTNQDEIGMDFRVLMMKAALAKLYPDLRNGDALHINLATGLPVSHMAQASTLKKHLIGQHLIHTDTTHFTANISEVAVMPEPRGTMFAFTLNADGSLNEYYDADTTVVFNGGAVTNDVQYDLNGEFVEAYSGSSRTGYHLAFDTLRDLIQDRYGETPSLHVLEMVIRNEAMKVKGKVIPMREEVHTALAPVRDGALELLSDTIQTAMSVDRIIVSGGFTLKMYDCISGKYEQSTKSDNPLYDTAQGYQNYAMMKWA
jgi:hypothetical protein